MKNKRIGLAVMGFFNIIAFMIWTLIIQTVDVQNLGVNGTEVGLATFNVWFHSLTGVNMTLYSITDWLGLVPIGVCFVLAFVGALQLVKRRSLLKVDLDIIISGVYYLAVISAYLLFEMIPLNYRPVLINGFMEASYPSSTTLLVLSVMPTLNYHSDKRIKNTNLKCSVKIISCLFSAFMVISRLISGVHWVTDIIGSVLLSVGLYCVFRYTVNKFCLED